MNGFSVRQLIADTALVLMILLFMLAAYAIVGGCSRVPKAAHVIVTGEHPSGDVNLVVHCATNMPGEQVCR